MLSSIQLNQVYKVSQSLYKSLFSFQWKESEKHLSRKTAVINVFILKKLDFKQYNF